MVLIVIYPQRGILRNVTFPWALLPCSQPLILPLLLCSPPAPVTVTLFGNRVFAYNQVEMRSLRWVLIQCGCVLIKEGHLALAGVAQLVGVSSHN